MRLGFNKLTDRAKAQINHWFGGEAKHKVLVGWRAMEFTGTQEEWDTCFAVVATKSGLHFVRVFAGGGSLHLSVDGDANAWMLAEAFGFKPEVAQDQSKAWFPAKVIPLSEAVRG